MHTSSLEAKTLGQLLLMQSIVLNLPDFKSISSFVCKGLKDIPGVDDIKIFTENIKNKKEFNSWVYIAIE